MSKTSLAIAAEPTAKVADQPLQLEVSQFVTGVDGEPNGYGSERGKNREAWQRPQRRGVPAGGQIETTGRVSCHGQGQEGCEGDVLRTAGLLNSLQVNPQARLRTKSNVDRV